MSIAAVAGKVVSEAMLSLYPVFVKNIGLPVTAQMWARFAAYAGISALFVDWGVVLRYVRQGWGLALAAVTLLHIYVSYRGFQLLTSGSAYTLFYVYPVLILLFAGKLTAWIAATAIAGVAVLARGESGLGVGMTLAAALTEAIIYFIVLRLPTKNNWNHVFLSYVLGALVLTALVGVQGVALPAAAGWALAINVGLGLFGYYLRFYAISNLPVLTYALLSNVGIAASFGYGYYFNGDPVGMQEVVGACLVAGACFLARENH